MISKKAQQEIIVTVLLVLIALAAVAAVATFVINNVKKSTAGADDKLACSKVELNIISYNITAKNISIQRLGAGDVSVKNITVSVNGVSKVAGSMNPGESITVNVANLVKGDKIEASAILTNNYACAVAASETVA